MKASSLWLREKTVLEVVNFIVTVFEIPVGMGGAGGLPYLNDRVAKTPSEYHWSSCGIF